MDFERASIKALFYDYPIEAIVKAIEKSRNLRKDDFLDILPQLVRWREGAFTTTEARLMENLAQDVWMHLDAEHAAKGFADEPYKAKIPFIYRPFMLVLHLAKKFLEKNPQTKYPEVRFDEFLRWKDATLFVGEDLFTTAFMANKDITEDENRRTTLCAWRDKIWHNDQEFNAYMEKGLTDVHAHFYASTDVFELNWLTLMNNPCRGRNAIETIKEYQDVTLATVDMEELYTYQRMCIAAAFLRMQFFKVVYGLYLSSPQEKDKEYAGLYVHPWTEMQKVARILQDKMYADEILSQLQSEISAFRSQSLKDIEGDSIDYALLPTTEIMDSRNNIFITFHGERALMYKFFYRFFQFDHQVWNVAPYFYLYLVLKTRIRKEFVQINQLKGFENFEVYQDRKEMFIEETDPIGKLYHKFVLQTTIRPDKADYLEGRLTPRNLDIRQKEYGKGVFIDEKVLPNPEEQLSFVVHFIKANYTKAEKQHELELCNRQDYPRYDKYRQKLQEEINIVLNAYRQQHEASIPSMVKREIPIVGIDAASTEMFCRPEVFGHIFRFAAKKGLVNRTYHVGEDFFDIVDGLRAIDEAILFLSLDSHCRIGHALAMGIDAPTYYANRRYRIIAPKQYVLDNCVWLCMKASQNDVEIPNSLETELNRLAKELYDDIGYQEKPFQMQSYWNSMLLRGDEPNNNYGESEQQTYSQYLLLTDWELTAEVDDDKVATARKDKTARLLYYQYNYDKSVKERGEIRYEGKYPESIVEVVNKLQSKMRCKVDSRQIAVEANPSSNMKIGFVDSYINHPILKCFDPIEKQQDPHYPLLRVSVNTDDRGVFDTTVYHELSLLALAMIKKKRKDGEMEYGTRQVMEYIDHLRKANAQQRFK